MQVFLRARRGFAAHPALQDACLALGCFALTLLAGAGVLVKPSTPPAEPLLFAALISAPLTVAGRWPVPVVAMCTAADILRLLILPADLQQPYPAATLLALYGVAVRTDRRTAWAVTVVSVLCVFGGAVALRPGLDELPRNLGVIPWTALPAAIGDAVRSRRELFAAAVDRAERAERTREEEALRRVTEERVRIARELHDVVAHHITLVNAQAGVAHHLVRGDPAHAHDHAYEALGRIRDTSRTALDELRATVSLLRGPGEQPPVKPAPGLADLDDLLASFRHSGLPVELTSAGQSAALPTATGLTLYRIVQEALTNTRKHAGPARARVHLEFTETAVRLTVADDGRGGPGAEGAGYGLIGMRERARTVGGTLTAAPAPAPGRGFCVEAELPLPAHSRGQP